MAILSRRDTALWACGFLIVAVWLVAIRFESTDADSMLYAGLSSRIAEQPWPKWIAPEWWGLWPRIGLTGYYREHPVGGFLLPALLAVAGVPGEQAAYIAGVAASLVVLITIGHLIAGVTSREDGRAALVLLQLMPVAFVFRVRANQEYLMLATLLVTIVGLDRVRRSWWGLLLVVAGVCGGLLIKGAFLLLTLTGAGLWMLLNPRAVPGSLVRPALSFAVALAAAAGLAAGYEALFLRVTGESFLATYWERQFSELQVSTPLSGALSFLQHVVFYIVRLLWHAAPWSLALFATTLHGRDWWRSLPVKSRRGLLFALGYAALLILELSPASRVAERYVFYGTYAVAAGGAVVAFRWLPGLRQLLVRLDARIPAFPAAVWFLLVASRLALGPWLPRL